MIQNYVIDSLVGKKTKTNKPFYKANLTDENGEPTYDVFIWSDFPGFMQIKPGSKVMGEIKDNGKGMVLMPTGAPGHVKTPAADGLETKRKNIEAAQDRKEIGVKVAGAQRDATLIVTALYADIIKTIPEEERADKIKEAFALWRDFFVEEFDATYKHQQGDIPF